MTIRLLVSFRGADGTELSPGLVSGPYEAFVKEQYPTMMNWDGTRQIWGPEFDVQPQGIKKDDGKAPLDLIDPWFISDVAQVLAFGAGKYGLNNYQKGMAIGKSLSGVLRHTFAVLRGENIDPETGLSHLAHAACGLMFTHYFIRTNNIKPDDRWSK